MVLLLLIVIAAIILTVATEHEVFAQQTTTNFLTYENSTFGIKVQYPASWDEEQNGTKQDTETDIVTFYPSSSNSNASLDVITDDISDEKGISLIQYASDSLTDLRQSLKDFKLVGSTTNNLLAGLPAYDYVYTYQDGNSVFKDMEIGAIKGDNVYILTYEAGTDEYAKYLPVIQQSINSFQITK